MKTFNLPDLGEGLAEAEIVRWHVNVGDHVKVDEPMLAVETAKAIVEVPSPFSGVIKTLHGKPGDTVATGALLVEFEPDARSAHRPTPAPSCGTHAHERRRHCRRQHADRQRRLSSSAVDSNTHVSATHDQRRSRPGRPRRPRARQAPGHRPDQSPRHRPRRSDHRRRRPARIDRAGRSPGARATATAGTRVNSGRRHLQPRHDSAAGEQLRGLRRAMAQSMTLARDNVMGCTMFDDADLHRWREDQDITSRSAARHRRRLQRGTRPERLVRRRTAQTPSGVEPRRCRNRRRHARGPDRPGHPRRRAAVPLRNCDGILTG